MRQRLLIVGALAFVLALGLALGSISNAIAADQPAPAIKVSYPDIWGAKIDFPDWAIGGTRSEVFIGKDGRIYINFTFYFAPKKGRGEILVDFFQNKIIFSEEHCGIILKSSCADRLFQLLRKTLQAERLWAIEEYKPLSFGPFKGANPPFYLRTDAPFSGCASADYGFFKISRKFRTSIEIALQKSLVYLPPEPVRYELETNCYGGAYYLRAYTFGMIFHVLPDGTLLMTPAQEGGLAPPFVIRFTSDFTSPFLDQREDLLLIEHDLLTKFGDLSRHLLPPWEADRVNAPVGKKPSYTSSHLEIENPIFSLYLRKYLKERIRKDD